MQAALRLSLRPYAAAFRARFLLLLQYRVAALAGFATQCWWGAIRIMVFAAFYETASVPAPLSLPRGCLRRKTSRKRGCRPSGLKQS